MTATSMLHTHHLQHGQQTLKADQINPKEFVIIRKKISQTKLIDPQLAAESEYKTSQDSVMNDQDETHLLL